MGATPPTGKRSVVGVFARANHPEGWGFPVMLRDEKGRVGWPTQPTATAHGYVVLFVRCADAEQLDAVVRRLSQYDKPFHGIGGDGSVYNKGNLREWFGGQFELLATVPDVDVPQGPFRCVGDNRMIAVYDAGEVLDA